MSGVYTLTYNQLLADLFTAYYRSVRGKRGKEYVRLYDSKLNDNLDNLCRALLDRRYEPGISSCFVISDPKKREIFAAEFQDRIVHHLYYEYTHEMLERTFVHDSYSCISKRGTHFGIDRLEKHIRSESLNYSRPCLVLKLDIRGYFMHINRSKLTDILVSSIRKMSMHKCLSKYRELGRTWCECVDIDFVLYLTRVFSMHDPTKKCIVKGKLTDWDSLPEDKSLFCSPEGCGLPIGNLTSQLFSNVYMNVFDQFMKRELKCKHYGRYVDDAYVVSSDRSFLMSLVPIIRSFLMDNLSLELHEEKTKIYDVRYGVSFLGAYLKPWRRYIDNKSLWRITRKIKLICERNTCSTFSSSRINSFMGIMSHYRAYNIQRALFLENDIFWKYGDFIRKNDKWVYRNSVQCQRFMK